MISAPEFDRLLDNYAQVIVQVGLAIQPGQRLFVSGAPLEAAPFVRRVAAHAYRAGAPLVDVIWADDQLSLIRLQNAPRDSFGEFAAWRVEARRTTVDRGDALLAIHADDPDLLVGQDQALITRIRQVAAVNNKATSDRLANNETPWLVVSVPVTGWNAKVFPELSGEEQEAAMWNAIFTMSRVTGVDPVADWEAHSADLNHRRAILNAKHYTALHYTGPGTDLTIGLPEGHRWAGAGAVDSRGRAFIPNIPTEEVFTLPHKDRVDGILSNTRPIAMPGVSVDGFTLTFEHGVITKAVARTGQDALDQLLNMDDGARRIGEVALVPDSSPISQSRRLFYNGLYDENAASHIALGQAYPFTLEGGDSMTKDQLLAAGANNSLLHLDFMVGSNKLDIDGINADGSREPLMRGGEWSF